ncbi:MAG: hypothetical protein P4L03_06305 [Terracidiphilus sp.]|nr:hypothetical protein [Terracidiphilus sp.]
MTTFGRVSTAVGALAAVVCACVLANHWLEQRYAQDRTAALGHKSAQHTAATVVRVERGADAVKVCFAIDSFAELPAEDQSFYETTERARAAGHGPRCVSAHNAALADAVKAQEKIDVYFTLENGGKISVVRVEAKGQEL